MKKIFVVLSSSLLLLSGCSGQINHTTIKPLYYDRAIVKLPDGGVVEGHLDNYYESEGYVVVMVNGVKYCTSFTNVTLIKTENNE